MAPKVNRPVALATLGVAALAGGFAAWRWTTVPASLPAQGQPTDAPGEPRENRALARRLTDAARRMEREPARAREELGRLYHANGFLDQAEEQWRWLSGAEPHNGEWTYLLADVRNQLGDPTEYEALLNQTLARSPEYAAAWLKFADLLLKTGRIDEAARAYQRRLALLPGDPYARLGLARVARQRGREAEAADAIAGLVRDHPTFAPAHNLHAENLAARGDIAGARRHRWLGREAGRFREADDLWLQRLVDHCHDAKRLATHGTAAYQLGDSRRARELVERAVQVAPDDPGAHELLGDLLLKLSDPMGARSALERAVQVAQAQRLPVAAHVYVNLAEALRLTGEAERALSLLEDAMRRDEAHELRLAKGVMLDALDRVPEAEAALREAFRRAPHDSAVLFNLAVVRLQQERREEATKLLQAALQQQPTHAKALTILGQLEIEAGRLEAAETYLLPLYEANPGIPEVQQLVGFWRLQAGLAATERRDLPAAERHFREGMEAHPDNADIAISLGGLLLTSGRADDALAPLARYRQLRPNEAQGPYFAAQALEQLGRGTEARSHAEEALGLANQAGNAAMVARCRQLLARLPE